MNTIQISNVVIRQVNNLFSLNDLHKASGGDSNKQPAFWLRNNQTKEFIAKIEAEGKTALTTSQGGKNRGTYVCKELVIHYGMWISAKFSLEVIRTFLEVKEQAHSTKTTQALPNGLTIEQQDEIKKLHRELCAAVPKEQQAKLAITLWSAVKAKFGVSYKEVAPEHYLEVMSLMARVAVEKGVLYGEVLDKEQPTKPTIQLKNHDYGMARFFVNYGAGCASISDLYMALKQLSELHTTFMGGVQHKALHFPIDEAEHRCVRILASWHNALAEAGCQVR